MSNFFFKIVKKLLENYRQDKTDIYENYYEIYQENVEEIIQSFLTGQKHIKWVRLPAEPFLNVWRSFAVSGIIRNEKFLFKAKKSILNNIARMEAVTRFVGHTDDGLGARDVFEDYDEGLWDSFSEERREEFYDYLYGADGFSHYSDYGLAPLKKLAVELLKLEDDPIEILFTIDKILNVIHMRNDLASNFIEGGSKVLDQIAEFVPDNMRAGANK